MPLRLLSSGLAIAWMGLIFYLSHQPVLPTPDLFPNQDKLFHAGVYGILGSLLLMSCRFSQPGYSRRQISASVLLASLYGLSDEIHQYFIPGRQADGLDWAADTLGALLAVLSLAWIVKKKGVAVAGRETG